MTENSQGPAPFSTTLFAATIFLSAFLLFQIQPMISKYILPWFGSTPGVWATALVFFQLMLLAGYSYAHFIVSRLTWRRQGAVHILLLALAILALPITPAESLKPIDASAPIGRILFILTVSVARHFSCSHRLLRLFNVGSRCCIRDGHRIASTRCPMPVRCSPCCPIRSSSSAS